jgi:ring-1,2-phenylacetyl-CoA epoxidase subunit PaaA
MSDRFTGTVDPSNFRQMPEEYQDLLLRVFYIQADAEIGGPHLYVDKWLLRAPTADDMWRVARIAAEEVDHFRKFNALLKTLGRPADDLIHKDPEDRMVDVFRHSMEVWEDFAAFSFLIDRVGRYQLDEFEGCSYTPIRPVLPRVIEEEKGHVKFGELKLKDLAQTPEGKKRAQAAIDKYIRWRSICSASLIPNAANATCTGESSAGTMRWHGRITSRKSIPPSPSWA